MAEKIDTSFVINTPEGLLKDNDRGCTERIKRLRRISHSTQPHLDLERAKIETDVYKEYLPFFLLLPLFPHERNKSGKLPPHRFQTKYQLFLSAFSLSFP